MTRVHWLFVTLATGGVTALAGVLTACSSSGSATNETGPDASADGYRPDVYEAQVEAESDSSMPDVAEESVEEAAPPGADGGAPAVSATTLDFGMVPCGGMPASPQKFTINNPSYKPVMWTASLMKGVNFQVSPTTGTLMPGQSADVTVTPSAVPVPSSTSANALGDIVNVSLNGSSVTVAVQETAQGAVLSFNPSSVPFGPNPISGGAIGSVFEVQNQGNAAISNVALTLIPDPASTSASTFTFSTNLIAQIPALMDAQVLATFTPMDTLNADATVSLSLGAEAGTAGLCALLPPALTLSGAGTNAKIAVTPTALTFTSDLTGVNPYVQCGYTGIAQTVTIQNTGAANATWSYSLLHGNTYYTVALGTTNVNPGTTETLGMMNSETLTITPKALPTNPSTAPDAYDDTLTITTNAVGDVPHTVALHQTAQGAILTRTTNSIGFGNVPGGTTNTQSYSFTNAGNVGITLTVANGVSNFVESVSPTVTVGPAVNGVPTSVTESVAFSPALPTGGQTTIQYTDTVTVAAQTGVPICNTTFPGTLGLSGTGTLDTITASPNTIQFGTAQCGGYGNLGFPVDGGMEVSESFTVTNNGPETSFTVGMKGPTAGPTIFSVTGPGGGPTGMLPSGNSTFTVTQVEPMPNTTSPTSSPYNDEVVLTPGMGTQVTVTVDIGTQGAVLSFTSTAAAAFGTEPVGSVNTKPYTLQNTGNVQVTPTLVVTTTAPAGVFVVSPSSGPVANGVPLPFYIQFTPAMATPYSGTVGITVPPMTPLCEPVDIGSTSISVTGM